MCGYGLGALARNGRRLVDVLLPSGFCLAYTLHGLWPVTGMIRTICVLPWQTAFRFLPDAYDLLYICSCQRSLINLSLTLLTSFSFVRCMFPFYHSTRPSFRTLSIFTIPCLSQFLIVQSLLFSSMSADSYSGRFCFGRTLLFSSSVLSLLVKPSDTSVPSFPASGSDTFGLSRSPTCLPPSSLLEQCNP